jgi:hypothetical protein
VNGPGDEVSMEVIKHTLITTYRVEKVILGQKATQESPDKEDYLEKR